MHGFTPWAGREGGRSEKSPGASEWKDKLEKQKKCAGSFRESKGSNEERI